MKTIKINRTYYVISTINSRIWGWAIYGSGTKEECKQIQLHHSAFQGNDIEADTLNKNSCIVSKTQATRKYKVQF